MPCFKRKKTGEIIEVQDEDFCNQVLRRQNVYEEIECPQNDAKKTESEGGSGATKESATPAPTQNKKQTNKGRPSKPRNQSKAKSASNKAS